MTKTSGVQNHERLFLFLHVSYFIHLYPNKSIFKKRGRNIPIMPCEIFCNPLISSKSCTETRTESQDLLSSIEKFYCDSVVSYFPSFRKALSPKMSCHEKGFKTMGLLRNICGISIIVRKLISSLVYIFMSHDLGPILSTSTVST